MAYDIFSWCIAAEAKRGELTCAAEMPPRASVSVPGPVNEEPPGLRIDDAVRSNPVVVVSCAWCPFCRKAKTAFEMNGASYMCIELEDEKRHALVKDTNAYLDYLNEITGVRYVPQIFIGGSFFGGGSDVWAKQEDGTLPTLLATAGAIDPPDHIQKMLSDHKVVLFCKAKDSASKKVKALLTELGVDVSTLELEDEHKKQALARAPEYETWLVEKTGQKTVPYLFVQGEFVNATSQKDHESLIRIVSAASAIDPKKHVEWLIKSPGIVLFTKAWDPECQQTKDALTSVGITKFKELQLEDTLHQPCFDRVQEYVTAVVQKATPQTTRRTSVRGNVTAGKAAVWVFEAGKYLGTGKEVVTLKKKTPSSTPKTQSVAAKSADEAPLANRSASTEEPRAEDVTGTASAKDGAEAGVSAAEIAQVTGSGAHGTADALTSVPADVSPSEDLVAENAHSKELESAPEAGSHEKAHAVIGAEAAHTSYELPVVGKPPETLDATPLPELEQRRRHDTVGGSEETSFFWRGLLRDWYCCASNHDRSDDARSADAPPTRIA